MRRLPADHVTLPQVSVIINVRNGAATLREALDSALAQTFRDFEIIVWDDASSDGSAAIVKGQSDPRINYFAARGKTSLGVARDMAIREAKGEWIAFLDQDDIWLPRKLEKQIALAASDDKAGLIYGRTVIFGGGRDYRDFDHQHEYRPLPEGNIFDELVRLSCFISMSSAMLRRSSVEALGGIPPQIEVTPDYFLFLGIARQHRALAVQEVVCKYRRHSGNMSRGAQTRINSEAIWLMEQWQHDIDPAMAAHRRRLHSTLIAFDELKQLRTVRSGLRRMFRDGSPAFLASRPFVRCARAIRRRFMRPWYIRN